MNKKFKGQGALEYLLLIGGAVLIAVIVIALLVGMGGQSRDTAQDQADRAQRAADLPQPAQIVSVTAKYEDCNTVSETANIEFSWRPLGEGGTHKLIIRDSANDLLTIDDLRSSAGVDLDEDDINPNEISGLEVDLNLNTGNSCGDSYFLIIETTKNNQTVSSQSYRFGWTQQ